MNLLDSYKITASLLENFIKEEAEKKETEKVAKDLANIFQIGRAHV